MGRRPLTPKLHTTRLTLRTPMSMTTHGKMWRPTTLPMRPILDARNRFSELKLSRGYLPIVALSNPSAGNLSPGVLQSPTSSPSSKGKKGKAGKSSSKGGSPKGGSPKGQSGASYKYTTSRVMSAMMWLCWIQVPLQS